MGKKLRSKRGSSSKIPLKEFHSSLVKKKLGPNSSNQANDKNQSNIDYMQRKLELEFEHDDFDIEETYYDSPEADNAMVGSSVCQGSSSEQGLGKTTVPKPMGHIETATKGSTPTKNVQDYNEAKGHAQVRMSCVEGLVDVASMDSQTEAEMVQSHCSNGLEASERERERTKKAFLGLGSRSLGVVQCGGVGLKLNRYWHQLQASATHSECRSIFPAIVAGQAFRIKRRHTEEQRIKGARARKKTSDDIFICERVCTSKRMLKKVGSFSKDPIPDTCVTVCGVSELDACSDACARTVYVNQHQVPNWNDICLRRCQSECLKLSASCAF